MNECGISCDCCNVWLPRSLLGPELVVVVLVLAEETRKQRLITRHSGLTKEVKNRMVMLKIKYVAYSIFEL